MKGAPKRDKKLVLWVWVTLIFTVIYGKCVGFYRLYCIVCTIHYDICSVYPSPYVIYNLSLETLAVHEDSVY